MFRLNYGSYPLSGNPYGKVKEGMSADDVRAALGDPHNRETRGDDGEGWYYYQDSFQIGWFCVDFGLDGRVKGTHGY
jgi:outer membrane protein assembly factor BamE (lipoprotein component of BamABCDE complex)